jgi:hypothetical protein
MSNVQCAGSSAGNLQFQFPMKYMYARNWVYKLLLILEFGINKVLKKVFSAVLRATIIMLMVFGSKDNTQQVFNALTFDG